MAVNPEGTLCQSRDAAWSGIRATKGVVNKGKYYYEVIVLTSKAGRYRVGWSLNEVSNKNFIFLLSFSLHRDFYVLQGNLDLGSDQYGFGFCGCGKLSNDQDTTDYGTAYGLNDVIGCALDLDNRIISFYKNGVELGKAFDINPEFRNKALFPAVALKVQLYIILACHSNC